MWLPRTGLTLGISMAIALSTTLAGFPARANSVPSAPWVTSVGAVSPRNNFTGWVGMRLQSGPSDILVDALGRWVLSGNSQSHKVRLVLAATGADIASATVTTSGQPAGAFAFTNLPVAVLLRANTTYYLVSQEFTGGDTWYDYNASLVTTTAAAATAAAWATDAAPGVFNVGGGANQSYGVPNLRYTTSGAAPSITEQPQNQTVAAGDTAVFTVSATGSPFTVQWQSRPPGGSFAPIGGATATVLTVPHVAAGATGTEYRAVLTNTSGSVTSTVATLAVNAVPPPSGAAWVTYVTPSVLRNNFSGWVGMRVQGGPSDLTVNALGRWVVSGNSQSHAVRLVLASTGADVATATVNTAGQPAGAFAFANLSTPVTLRADTTYFLVSQEVAGGDAWYEYNAATITTSAASDTGAAWASNTTPGTFYVGGSAGQSYGVPNLRYAVPEASPVITQQPQDQTVLAGGTAVFVAAATGAPVPSVQWESKPRGGSFAPIGGATSGSLTVSGVTLGDSETQYRAVFSNPAGTATTSAAILTVRATPPASGMGFVTSFTPSSLRNNFSGWVGMVVKGGSADISVNALGRWVVSGNSQSHTVRLVLASTGGDVASAVVNTAGQPAGAFAFTPLADAVTLRAGTTYYLLSQEFAGGDTWYEYNTATITTSAASNTAVAWATAAAPGTVHVAGLANQSYGVPNLRYTGFNRPPVAVADGPYLLHENEKLGVAAPGTLANDSDPDGDAITAILVDPPSHGDALLDPDGGFSYLPATNYSGSDSFTYKAHDGTADSAVATVTLTVERVNGAPVITLSGSTASYTEDGSPVAVDSGLTVSDIDDTELDSGVVEIVGGLEPGDKLAFDAGASGITDTNPSLEVLALSGPATVAQWQSVLQSVVFATTSQNPGPSRTVRFLVGDGEATGSSDKLLTVVPVEDDSVIIMSTEFRAYTEDGPPLIVDPALTVADVDDTVLTAAYVLIFDPEPGDTLSFTPGTSGLVDTDPMPDVLWLVGPASVAHWEEVLRTVTFSTTNQNPRSGRDIQFVVEDGMMAAGAVRTIAVVPVNDAPTLTPPDEYVINEDATLEVYWPDGLLAGAFDPEGDPLRPYVVDWPLHGGLAYSTEGSIIYDPMGDYSGHDSFTYVVSDGYLTSSMVTVYITVLAVNDAPRVTLSGSTPSYTADGAPSAVDAGLTVADVDDTELVSGIATISAGGQTGDALAFTPGTSGITDADPAAGSLALTGTATVAQWQAVLRSVVFSTTNPTPGASRTIRFVVNDGSAGSAAVEKTTTLVGSG